MLIAVNHINGTVYDIKIILHDRLRFFVQGIARRSLKIITVGEETSTTGMILTVSSMDEISWIAAVTLPTIGPELARWDPTGRSCP